VPPPAPPLSIWLIKPTRYDDEGYPLQWRWSMIPANSLACVASLVRDSLGRGVAPGARLDIIDEINTHLSVQRIIREARRRGGPAVVFLVGVQTNQFPRALDLARAFRAGGLHVCIGGFHVSGVLAMLDELTPELKEAQALGVSLFAGEAESRRLDEVLTDAAAGALKPLYDHTGDAPSLEGEPTPWLDARLVARTFTNTGSFDLGRGCPFECSFCTIINVQGRKSRFRTCEDLETIIRDNARQGVTRFFVTDDNFARNRNWKAFLETLARLKHVEGIDIRLIMQVDALAHKIPGFIDACVAAGLEQLFVGLENINSDNLDLVKKRQNRVEDYREMFLAWKKHPLVIICGYIVGFPGDTKASILRDIEVVKRELPVDMIYLNMLTPLPGSEDHKRAMERQVWMDPDLNRYDLNHRVTRHAIMSDEDWESAFAEAHASFYSVEHMHTVLRRMAALGSNKRYTTVQYLVAYREMMRMEGVAKLEGGLIRRRERRARRPGLPLESPLAFYPRHYRRVVASGWAILSTYLRLRRFMLRVTTDADRTAYRDAAIMPAEPQAADALLEGARGADLVAARRARRATVLAIRESA
jgi:radical SAM superfamily enzyme YgiQ (UPF0313 family)